jgi:hypothetical protein
MVNNAGNIADEEILTMPLAVAINCRTVVVTPDQSTPMIALSPSEVIKNLRSALKTPLSVASLIINKSPFTISRVKDSISPPKTQ